MEKISIGVDIGGSHVTTVAVDLDSRKSLTETLCRRDVDSNGTAESILSAWAAALKETISLSGNKDIAGVGFAMPGPFDYPAGIARFKGVKKFDALNGVNVREEMIRRVGLPPDKPVRFVNDATCFAIGEAWMGPAAAYSRVMAITLGTGFGSAFLHEGVPIETGSEVPPQGCVYHLPFGSSNADDHFSTRWFVARYNELSGVKVEGVKEIADAYSHDETVRNIYQEFGNNLGIFLSPWISLFRAECLVIGGNIAKSYDHFSEPFKSSLVQQGVPGLTIYISALGEDAAIMGSARLSDNEFYAKLDLSAFK
ncbi:MAG: ROK family protein [Bacteroidales bacterium]